MQLLQNFFDPSTPSMTKRRDAMEGEKKWGGASTPLPAVYRLKVAAQTTTAGTPHARANLKMDSKLL